MNVIIREGNRNIWNFGKMVEITRGKSAYTAAADADELMFGQ